jgi:hypothetical protein
MKTLQALVLNFNSKCSTNKTGKFTWSKFFGSSVLLFLIFQAPTVNANTKFYPKIDTTQLVISTPSDSTYGCIDFKVLGYDFAGDEDRMEKMTISVVEEGKSDSVQLLTYMVGNNAYYDSWTASTAYANAGRISRRENIEKDLLRYTSFRWYYPQRYVGKKVTFKFLYSWDLNWFQDQTTEILNITYTKPFQLPVYTPTQLTSAILAVKDTTTVGKWFKFSWSGADVTLGSTKMIIYNNDKYTIKNDSISTLNAGANSISLKLDSLDRANTIYPKLVYTCKTPYGNLIHECKMNSITANGLARPVINGAISFDDCSKTTTINWNLINPTPVNINSKIFIYRKQTSEANFKLLNSTGLAMNVTFYNDNNGLIMDSKYIYIVRVIPDVVTNANAVTYTTPSTATKTLKELMFSDSITLSRKQIVFTNFKANSNLSVNGSTAYTALSWNQTWCTNQTTVTIVRKEQLTGKITTFPTTSSLLKYSDNNVTNGVPYNYCLVVDNNGRSDSSAWLDVTFTDHAKFLSFTTSKGVYNDRIRLSWEIDKPLLSNKFIIKRKIYDNGSDKFKFETVAEKPTTTSLENWEDLSVSPGILYQYQVISYYLPATKIPENITTEASDGLGFSQPIGTINGNIAFGSGTAVNGVNVVVENADISQKLYKSMNFPTGASGDIQFHTARHGCVEKGFTWQAWLKPANYTQANANIYHLNGEYQIFQHGGSISLGVGLYNVFTLMPKGRYFHVSVTYDKGTLKIYLDGILKSTNINITATCANKTVALAKIISSFNSSNKYVGLIDEMRLWDRALTEDEISKNYDRYLSGSENDLIGYWQMDEGINSYAFDKSNISKSYNENHITLTKAESSDSVPTPAQLSIKSTTDKNGNYIIPGVPYKGSGSTYQVVPALGNHVFEPAKQLVYIGGASSEVQSKISFKDVSSFKVQGTIYYKNTNYPVQGVEFLVDGNVCMRNNEKIYSSATGTYDIDVPIGEHIITPYMNGHKFIDSDADATLKMGLKYNFLEPKTNIDFTDTTTVKLVGRVVGGAIQAAKPIGFARSKANIGQAELSIRLVKANTNFNKTGVDLVLATGSAVVKSTAIVKTESDIITIKTDDKTGEFSLKVPPVPMIVTDVKTGDLSKDKFNLANVPGIIMNPLISYVDTIHSGFKIVDEKSVIKIDTCKYEQRLNITYYVPKAEFIIKDANYPLGGFGDSLYTYTDITTNNEIKIPLFTRTAGLVTYKVGTSIANEYVPVFTQGNRYRFEIMAYEKYVNPTTNDIDIVALSNANLSITNKWSTNEALSYYKLDSLGKFQYNFMAGVPSLISDYTKTFIATIEHNFVDEDWVKDPKKAIILGALPVAGVDFVTKGPDNVIAILRDPPGSNSFATLKKGSKISNTRTYKGIGKESTGAKFTANLGGKVTLNLLVSQLETENKMDIGAGITQSVVGSDATSRTESYSMNESISTSSSKEFVGAEGDVYIANSSNIGFAKCTQLNLSSSYLPTKKAARIYIPMGDSTSFRYTQKHIVTNLIPKLRELMESYLTKVENLNDYKTNRPLSQYLTLLPKTDINYGKKDTYTWVKPSAEYINPKDSVYLIDSVLFFATQINHWENIVRNNEIEKLWAAGKMPDGNNSTIQYDAKNLSFDAGVILNNSITRTSNCIKTNNVVWEVEAAQTTTTGLTFNKFGFTIETDKKVGGGEDKTNEKLSENTITYEYTLEDNDAGNYFSVDVFTPRSQTVTPTATTNGNKNVTSYAVSNVEQEGGPIFVTRGGNSSCPYEKADESLFYKNSSGKSEYLNTSTVSIEKPGIDVLVSSISGIASGKQATYDVDLKNLSETNTACWLKLSVDPASNPRGAIINIDGSPLTEPRLLLIPPSIAVRKTIRLTQSSLDDLEFNNIVLRFESPCDTSIVAKATISAKFVPSCSEITMQIENRLINTEPGSELNIVLKDFDKNYKKFAGIRLHYKEGNSLNWKLAQEFVLDSALMKPSPGFIRIGSSDININYNVPMALLLNDQTYQFRAQTVCAANVYTETPIITVVKDMKKPLSMGLPSPTNGVLTPETEISVTFNEKIQSDVIAGTDVQVFGVLNGYVQTDNVGLAFDGKQKAFTESTLNLQGNFTIEGKFKASGNTVGTIFSIGEGKDKVTLQAIENNLKAIVGTTSTNSTNLAFDPSFQYFAMTYDNSNKELTLMLWSGINSNRTKLFTMTLPNTISPVGRLVIGENFKGAMCQLSVWNELRTYGTIAEQKSKSKTGKEINLMGYWAMDEGSGKLAADKARGRNLTVASSWFITPKGYAVTLDGNNHVVAKSSHIPITTTKDFTIEFWFKGASGQKNATLYSCIGDTTASKNLSISFNEDGKLNLLSNGINNLIPSGDVLDNMWHHFAMSTMRGGNANVYIDGVQKFRTSASNIGGMSSDSMAIGARRSFVDGATKATIDRWFTGAIDEFRIWESGLTSENIKLNMNNKLSGNETGLVAYYPFEKFNSSKDVIPSLDDFAIPAFKTMPVGGTAQGKNVTYTDITAAIKANRSRTKVLSNFTASDNKIVINILEDASTIENCVLEFEVERILDLNFNRLASPLKWTAFVDLNRLKWETETVNLTKEVLAPMTFNATISNNSGKYENYVITGLPGWLSVNKTQGTLNPLAKEVLILTVDNSTNIGAYECDVRITGSKLIDEMLPVSLKVTGPRPDWTVNPYGSESSMNVVGQIKIGGVYQEDKEDVMAAFMGTRCVGLASPVFDKERNGYYLYMDIYGNAADNNQALTYSLWDAGTGRIYPGVDLEAGLGSFTAAAIIGTIESPKTFNATDKVEQQLSLKQGWNWLSTNVVSTTPSLIDQFKAGIGTVGEQLKSKNDGFIDYSNGAWYGTLLSLNQTSMYMLKTNEAKTVKMVGAMAKSEDFKITLNKEWNYIGYLPSFVAPLKVALSGLSPNTGDQIKGQVGFASYSGTAWYGSLQYMMPGLGYMYNSKDTNSFKYPAQYLSSSKVIRENNETVNMKWPVDANKYQMSMTVTGIASINGSEVANSDIQMGVFVDNECRGTVSLKYIDSYNRYMAFIMVWGNLTDANKKITFKSYNPNGNQELIAVNESLTFVPDNIVGSPASPYKISFISSGKTEVDMNRLKVYPNPVTDMLHFDYDPSEIEQLEVVDNMGRVLISNTRMIKNSVNVQNLVPGVYTLRIKHNGNLTNHFFIRK